MSNAALPLENTAVVSIATNVPGPAAAARLTQLGATVTKVEPPSGDLIARVAPDYYAELTAGQEVVARMDTYGSVRRHLVGLVLKAPTIPPRGAKLFSGDREVGWVSSAVHSPQMGQVIAFGFPLRDFSKPETPLTIDLDGQRIEAVVRTLPFYRRPRS